MQSARGFEYGVRHIISPQSGRLIDVLLSTLSLDRTEIEFLLGLGSIYLNHKRVKEDFSVSTGDYLRVHTKPRRFPLFNINWNNRVIFNDENFIVANKVSGIPVHASVDNDQEHLQFYLSKTLGCDLFVTHRLDVPTRGLIVFAKNLKFQSEFNKLLLQREMTKIYKATVEGQGLAKGLLTHYMEPSPRAPKTVSREPQEGWQDCVLEILDIKLLAENRSELKIHLLTGRTHQIRAQLGYEKHPIIGDHAYGAKKIDDIEKIELEANELSFVDPITNQKHSFNLN
ncbi:RNA pseudouridine synthase [Bdellovibrio bacteriovorus]|uniref:RNA pseudouridine synthase n=1 Tax=Bdellovibrio bacteriovorus TaxID=959 RepID=A0A150WD55_BDEBC|nr:RluA family pseudouridine synthase [Bdellovibrio bacteriovorus]KYG60893.1 RNA pseudouridine synthase [Bdellovibrio bacteriovorus]